MVFNIPDPKETDKIPPPEAIEDTSKWAWYTFNKPEKQVKLTPEEEVNALMNTSMMECKSKYTETCDKIQQALDNGERSITFDMCKFSEMRSLAINHFSDELSEKGWIFMRTTNSPELISIIQWYHP